jgi:hypothetical protein
MSGNKSLKYIVRVLSSTALQETDTFNYDCENYLNNFTKLKVLDTQIDE